MILAKKHLPSLIMDSAKKIPVAIAGMGFGQKVHLKALLDSNEMEPVAIWHPNKHKFKEWGEKHEIKFYDNWDSILKDQNIEGIIIATPPEPRFLLAKEALSYGKHLLLEKPVALRSAQIIELQKIALKKQLSVAVDFEYRVVPHFLHAKKILDSGAIGNPWLIKLEWIMSSRADYSRPWNWYSDSDKGGGVIGALGTHAIDILHWLIGPTKNVSALNSTSITNRKSLSNGILKNVTSEDICLSYVELENMYSTELIPCQISLSSTSLNGRGFWLEVYGSDGNLVLGSNNQKDYVHGFGLWVGDREKQAQSINPDKEYLFNKTWEDGRVAPVKRIHSLWAESIRAKKPIIPGLQEGLESQKVCEKMKESNLSGLKLSVK
ncbi:Oxidoreductase [Prochlorococcus sp. MIT 0601]|nr:Oxidoreductase [Prochlorococcus sp. MIT 0601]